MAFNIRDARNKLARSGSIDRLDPRLGAVAGQLNGQRQAQQSYMWEVEFIDPLDPDAASTITFYARNTGIPMSSREQITRYVAGVEYSYSGRDVSPKIMRVTFWDNQSHEIYRYFMKWFELSSLGATHMAASPRLYRKEIRLRLKDTSDFITTDTTLMTSAYPIEVSEPTLTYDNSEVFTFDVAFKFQDKVVGA